jgi:serine/threonine protein phosphatase PrpC
VPATSDSVFLGVWDGNGGGQCASYLAERARDSFYQALAASGGHAARAFAECLPALDRELAAHTSQLPGAARFCGSCAVAAHIGARGSGAGGAGRLLTVANLGDSRAVLGGYLVQGGGGDGALAADADGLRTVELSRPHHASDESERARIAAEHGCAVEEVAVDKQPERQGGDWRVKGVAAVTRALGLQQVSQHG